MLAGGSPWEAFLGEWGPGGAGAVSGWLWGVGEESPMARVARDSQGQDGSQSLLFLRPPAVCSSLLLPAPCPSLWLSGFVESELKKLLVAQQESQRRKMGSHEGWEPLVQPEITLEGIMGDQVCHPARRQWRGRDWRPPTALALAQAPVPPPLGRHDLFLVVFLSLTLTPAHTHFPMSLISTRVQTSTLIIIIYI